MTEGDCKKTQCRFPNGFMGEIDDMMQDFCLKGEWTSNCCPQFLRMYRSSDDCEDCIMTMCTRMQKVFFDSNLKRENK